MNVAVADPTGLGLEISDVTVVDTVETADLVVAAGTAGVLALIDDAPDAPVVVVGHCPGVPSIDIESVDRAVEKVRDGHVDTVTRPVLSVTSDGDDVASVFFDVTLVTTLPAKISEFRLEAGGVPVTTVRADGFVVSTPAGSVGYNRDVHGSIVDPGISAVAAAPIAPFVTNPDQYVLDAADVTLTVVRDETDVTLHCDGDPIGPVDPRVPIHVSRASELTVVDISSDTGFFDVA